MRNSFIPISDTSRGAIDYLLGILADARWTTLEQIAGIEQVELDWVYADGWNSVGALLAHLTANDHYFRILFVENRQLTDDEVQKWSPGQLLGEHVPKLTATSLRTHLANLEESRAQLLAALESVSFPEFTERRKGYNSETGFNMAWSLYHLAEDEVHHRGQISLIRKLYASLQ